MSYGFYLFGSVQRGNVRPYSDIDVLYIGDPKEYDSALVQLEQFIQVNMPQHYLRKLDVKIAPIDKVILSIGL